MKCLFILLITGLLTSYQLFGQSAGQLKVKASADIAREVDNEVKYRFPQFKKGEIIFIAGQTANALLNYNLLLNEIHYIDRQGDTLALDQEQLIKHLSIDSSTFYYDQKRGYQELISDYKTLKLTRHQQLRIVNREKLSAYGQATAASSIRSYSAIEGGNTYYKLNPSDILTLNKQINFFLIDNNKRCFAANKPNILKLFSQHKKQIESYLQKNKVDFTKAEDLQKLLLFCSQLA